MRKAVSIILTLLCCGLIALAAWWWSVNMVRVPTATPDISKEALADSHLGAAQFLRSQGIEVIKRDNLSLAQADQIDAGVLLLGDYHGLTTQEQGETLLSWVHDGGVLISTAGRRYVPDSEEDEDKKSSEPSEPLNFDPIFERFQVAQIYNKRARENIEVTPPGSPYPLKLADAGTDMHAFPGAPKPLWADNAGKAVRVYEHGKGKVVLLAWDRFDNTELMELDHAELLLRLVQLRSDQRSMLIVDRLETHRWYQLLWARFGHGIAALPLVLLLLLWAAVPRFGPRLPDLAPSRRAVLEHIDAASRWLWRTPKGRQQLLDALRASVLAGMLRRSPSLLRKTPAERVQTLASTYRLDAAELEQALHAPAASQPVAFTLQIHTLQTLRKHHER
ncbi:hypothetical protein GCM10027296_19720 [Chitinimonas naiadis]